MGKEEYRFKLSDLMPNSLFYKLKDMRGRGKKEGRGSRKPAAHQNSMDKSQIPITEPFKSMSNQRRSPPSPPTQPYATNRPSYYIPSRDRAEKLTLSPINHKAIDTSFPLDSPKKTNKKHKEKPLNSSSNPFSSSSPVFTCMNPSSLALSSRPFTGHRRLHGLGEDFKDDEFIASSDYSPNPPLRPVLTKPRLLAGRKQSPKPGSLISNGSARRSPSGSLPIKMRIKSPKLAKKMAQQPKKKGLAESFVVVKSSSDPQREFRESMMEMIVENNLCSLKELEELLACYLSLNSGEYHDLIVKVFKQIWLDLTELLLQSQ